MPWQVSGMSYGNQTMGVFSYFSGDSAQLCKTQWRKETAVETLQTLLAASLPHREPQHFVWGLKMFQPCKSCVWRSSWCKQIHVTVSLCIHTTHCLIQLACTVTVLMVIFNRLRITCGMHMKCPWSLPLLLLYPQRMLKPWCCRAGTLGTCVCSASQGSSRVICRILN